jgi:hypothetical protein
MAAAATAATIITRDLVPAGSDTATDDFEDVTVRVYRRCRNVVGTGTGYHGGYGDSLTTGIGVVRVVCRKRRRS